MLNYGNLSDVEFEYLCQDIMQEKLGLKLRRFAAGADGGVDIADNAKDPKIVVQVKHYINSTVPQLKQALKKELPKAERLNPEQYYVCTSKTLSPKAISWICEIFSGYMESENNIITISEIEDFLSKPENCGILEKHFKLWIESTGILQHLLDGNIFVDSEVLVADANEDLRLFVRTSAYDKAKKLLDDNKILFIVGDPGVGKSMTSKMLVLNYSANGYKVRVTSNTSDFSSLKRSLSRDPTVKEIILVDDCFGQAYFDLHEDQNTDLLSLIKYVYASKNKLLILNSRVTIFQEAKERKRELVKAIESNKYGVYILNMSELSEYEKAQIFYNHLFASQIDYERFGEIRKERRYRKIISHRNYNPRIIEYLCNPKRYSEIPPKDYYAFVKKNLDNPREVWKDEYEKRLQTVDRILLLTVFSLSNYNSREELVQACFNFWINREHGIDRTVNQYEAALLRLSDAFLRIVDVRGQRMIGVTSPAVNDYIEWRLENDKGERDYVLEHASFIQQYCKLLSRQELLDYAESMIASGTVASDLFANETDRYSFIAWCVGQRDIKDKRYITDIQKYFLNPFSLIIGSSLFVKHAEIIESFITRGLIDFYQLSSIYNEANIKHLLEGWGLETATEIATSLSPLFDGENRCWFVRCVSNVVQSAVEDYCDDVDATEYNPDLDYAVRMSTYDEDLGVDKTNAVRLVVEDVEQEATEKINEVIAKLPQDIKAAKNYMEDIKIEVAGADEMVEAFLTSVEVDFDDEDDTSCHEVDEIDLMFER